MVSGKHCYSTEIFIIDITVTRMDDRDRSSRGDTLDTIYDRIAQLVEQDTQLGMLASANGLRIAMGIGDWPLD
jgi:hypothetical protein